MLQADEIEKRLRQLMLTDIDEDAQAEMEAIFSSMEERDTMISCLLEEMLFEVDNLLAAVDELEPEDDFCEEDESR